MKTIRRVVFGTIIALPLFLAPSQSKAGDLLGGFIGGLIGGGSSSGSGSNGSSGSDCPPAPPSSDPGNSAPIDGGLIFLLVAGLALGAKLVYEKNKIENSLI